MDKETEALRRKVEKLENRTSPLVLIGPGPKGFLHQEKALNEIAERDAEEFAKGLEKIDIKALKKKVG